jgi:hypothetical protein
MLGSIFGGWNCDFKASKSGFLDASTSDVDEWFFYSLGLGLSS